MNKKCLILLPAIALLSFPSCNRTTILTFDSGAGCFYDDAVHRSYHINPGTKLSDLNIIPHPTAFHDEELFPDFMNVYGWADDKGLVDKDYIIGGNVTLTACYFPSLATAIEESNKILKQKYDEILLQVVEPSIREKVENAYNEIIKNLNDAKNEFEVAAVFAVGNGDLNAIVSVISSYPEKIDMLSTFMSQFLPMCFEAKNQLATIAGDVFGELCKGLAVSYDAGD